MSERIEIIAENIQGQHMGRRRGGADEETRREITENGPWYLLPASIRHEKIFTKLQETMSPKGPTGSDVVIFF